jgi:DNA-directed RNA polymerase subunit K/omega
MSKMIDDDDPKLTEMDDEEEEEDEEDEDELPRTTHRNSKATRRVMLSGAEDDEGAGSEDEDEDDDEGGESDDENEGEGEEEPRYSELATSAAQASATGMNFAFDELADDDDVADDDEEDERYLQKFDENMKKNVIQDYHPVMIVQNSDEIEVLSKVIRDQDGRIIDPLHQSLPFITKYERTRILGERARQINAGSPPFVAVEPGIIDGYLIALQEFKEKKIPFILKRPISGNHVEYWKLSDLEIL